MTDTSRHIDLVDRYLQAVRFWLPKTHRQDDLMAELGEDLRSQIDEKETELGHPLDKVEVAAILRRCGSPMIVAGHLGPQRHLIGPTLFPIYTFVLKMVLLWILIPIFIFIVGPVNLVNSGNHWPAAILRTFGNLWAGLFIAAGIITLVFAIIERTSAHLAAGCKWDPLKLPPVRNQERKPSLLKGICEFGFNIFGMIWLLLVPAYPFLVLGPAAVFLKATPLLHTFYVPFVLVSVFALVRSGITLARPQWAWFPLVSQLLQSAFSLILLNYLIKALANAPSAHPFVMLQDGMQTPADYVKIVAIVNISLLVSVVFTWIGICIATLPQTWALLRYLRGRANAPERIASWGVR